MSQSQSVPPLTPESLNQLSKAELVQFILTQQKVIGELQLEIEKLKFGRDLDSKTSSKPPSTDLLKKSEKAKEKEDSSTSDPKKRKPVGQPGHQGKPRFRVFKNRQNRNLATVCV